MDMVFSMLYVGYFGSLSKISGTLFNGITDGVIDIVQTHLFLTPEAQQQIEMKY